MVQHASSEELDQLRKYLQEQFKRLPQIKPPTLPGRGCENLMAGRSKDLRAWRININGLFFREWWLWKLLELPLDDTEKRNIDGALSECGVELLAWYQPLHDDNDIKTQCPDHGWRLLHFYDVWEDPREYKRHLHEDWRKYWHRYPLDGDDWHPHYYKARNDWGIYITLKGIKYVASQIISASPNRNLHLPSSYTAALLAMESLWRHELFHHLVEAYSLRVERRLHKPRYCDYSNVFYHQKWPNALEDALANRYVLESPSLMPVEDVLMAMFDRTPGSYREYKNYLSRRGFEGGIESLCALVISSKNNQLPSWCKRFPQRIRLWRGSLLDYRCVPVYIVLAEDDIAVRGIHGNSQ